MDQAIVTALRDSQWKGLRRQMLSHAQHELGRRAFLRILRKLAIAFGVRTVKVIE